MTDLAANGLSAHQARRMSLARLLKSSGCRNPRIVNSTEEILAILRLGRVRHEAFMQTVERIGNISQASGLDTEKQSASAALLHEMLEAKGRVVNEKG